MRFKRLVLLSLAAFALLPAAALRAARLPSGAEISVNVSHVGVHLDPSVAVFPDGGFVVVWSNGPGYGRLAIHARLFAPNGSPASGEFRLVDPGTGSEHADQVVADRDGTFLVAWTETRSPGGGVSDVFVRRFRRNGTPVGARSQVNLRRSASQYKARLAVGANGRFAVAWTANVEDRDPYVANAMARFFAADGTPLGDEILVAKGSNGDGDIITFESEAVTLAPDGTLAVVFQDQDANDGIFTTYLALYKANREISSKAISQYDQNIEGSGGAALTRAADGSLVAAWSSSTLLAQRFSPQGVPQDKEFVLPKRDFPLGESVPPSIPRLAALPEGGFLAAWAAAVDGDHNARVFARVFTAEGTPLTRDFQLSSDFVEPVAFYNSVTVAANQKGPAVVVWQEKGGANLRARLFTVR